MSDSLKARVREKMLRQITEDTGYASGGAEEDDPRLVSLDDDLNALDGASEGDPVIEELAAKYWVP
ncbi:hypothetical protein [Rhodococcus tukisamuensis]|uniref:Uncharacterized protein n=1 Tax=Rhodococcus tukisamuensis TaxID=168276 RepID=A0A1G6N5Q3_9NOCA|nr:hypothetical protein [Rhodococcus tukisamuensis]SDC62764.1 hypothetical protein SAMN05444580_101425 [Rhodococcus tukisamuensis]